MPNQEQLISIIRQIMLMTGGSLVTKGYIDDATLNIVVGALLALGASAWAIYSRRVAGQIASVASLAVVEQVNLRTTSTAAAIQHDKVVGPYGT